ncbi:hypothetical protein Ct9H90mP12_1700 [bacterium]|nr:MAG: hypothetical protein Ct9H90mP12_1700 [bacterium]
MSGDSDFVELVVHLKAEGVRVEIAAVKQNTAKILLAEANYYHEITRMIGLSTEDQKELNNYYLSF